MFVWEQKKYICLRKFCKKKPHIRRNILFGHGEFQFGCI